jgi:nucleoside-diphosphate-sugar epimerase
LTAPARTAALIGPNRENAMVNRLVTGAGGFIGGDLTQLLLLDAGRPVPALDRYDAAGNGTVYECQRKTIVQVIR